MDRQKSDEDAWPYQLTAYTASGVRLKRYETTLLPELDFKHTYVFKFFVCLYELTLKLVIKEYLKTKRIKIVGVRVNFATAFILPKIGIIFLFS